MDLRAEWPLQGIQSEKVANGRCSPISTNHVALFGLSCTWYSFGTRFYPSPCFGHIPARCTLFWPPPIFFRCDRRVNLHMTARNSTMKPFPGISYCNHKWATWPVLLAVHLVAKLQPLRPLLLLLELDHRVLRKPRPAYVFGFMVLPGTELHAFIAFFE